MTNLEEISTSSVNQPVTQSQWQTLDSGPLGYCCDVRLLRENKGYTAYVAQLPGVVSQGESLALALANIMEALRGTLQAYQEEGMPIPWRIAESPEPSEKTYRVAVNV